MKKLLFTLLLIAVLASACTPATALDNNWDTWDRANVTHYRFQLTISCFCPFFEQMPLTIEVRDGQVISMTAANGADIAPFEETFGAVATIDKLFAKTEEALKDADEVKVEYDATYGFPTSVTIDYIKLAIDDEMYYTVSNFEVLK